MTKVMFLRTAWLLMVVAAFAGSSYTTRAASTDPASPATGPTVANPVATGTVENSGVVEGIVRYLPDPGRPWRFSRYYVRDTGDGSLAEAVVALEGLALAASAPPATPRDHTMDQVDFQFTPETMAVRAGDPVRITNSDDALHNVMTSDGGEPFNVNVVKGGEFTRAFHRAGGLREPVRLGCVFHGGMRAWIYVFDHPWFKVTEADGAFRFENVPPGEYTLGVIHPSGRLRWNRKIEVKSNGKTPVEIILSPDDLIRVKPEDD